MKRLLTALCAVSGVVIVTAQERPPDAAQPVFRSTADVVVLDAVVRDRRGRIVRDLKTGDVEIYEDGVRQQVAQFRFFEGGVLVDPGTGAREPGAAPGSGATSAPGGHVQTLRHANLVTLVFDQLAPQARTLAR